MEQTIEKYVREAVKSLYKAPSDNINIIVEKTKKGIDGHYTIVVFPFVKYSKKSPPDTAKEIAVFIKSRFNDIGSYNVVNGFLNFKMTSEYWVDNLNKLSLKGLYDESINNEKKNLMLEFSSPNTNKPLHLGHIRNNLLGDSLSRIIKANGNNVIKTNLINDRGIHICKTILAWKLWGDNKNPKDVGVKGDKYVGDLYVKFENEYKKQIQNLIDKGVDEKEAQNQAELIIEAREILKKWENNDAEILEIWSMMNSWVYEGFDETYKKLNISFDKIYYESETYLIGKEVVINGLENQLFSKDADNSVWAEFDDENIDRKLLIRSDGTTVYITQDIGTAIKRLQEYDDLEKILYVVGNEQNHHFKVLKKIIAKIDKQYADVIEHLSYGMVELPEGKMKSREGKVVDADDLIDEMIKTAKTISEESGKAKNLPEKQRDDIIKKIAMAALKYYILKVDPKKNIIFDPKESIDFNGNTGPFIQYTYARIMSVLRNAEEKRIKFTGKASEETRLSDKEVAIISNLKSFPTVVNFAAKSYNPSIIANYLYDLVKEYNQFYNDFTILKAKDADVMQFRLLLSQQVAETIKEGMSLLGIEVPEVM